MEVTLWNICLPLTGGFYLGAVLWWAFSGPYDKWWEPLVLPFVMPLFLVYEHRMSIAATTALIAAIGAVLWLFVMAGDLFRWIWNLT